jgi:mannose-6-phosphate isomerase-like protein (cupin superfamily)
MNHLVLVGDSEKHKTEEDWGSLAWMANQTLSGSSVTVGRLVLRPGFSDSPHSHSNADEVIYVFKGRVRVQMGGTEVDLQAGDALTIPLKLVHRIKNTGNKEAEMTLSYSSGIRKYTAE